MGMSSWELPGQVIIGMLCLSSHSFTALARWHGAPSCMNKLLACSSMKLGRCLEGMFLYIMASIVLFLGNIAIPARPPAPLKAPQIMTCPGCLTVRLHHLGWIRDTLAGRRNQHFLAEMTLNRLSSLHMTLDYCSGVNSLYWRQNFNLFLTILTVNRGFAAVFRIGSLSSSRATRCMVLFDTWLKYEGYFALSSAAVRKGFFMIVLPMSRLALGVSLGGRPELNFCPVTWSAGRPRFRLSTRQMVCQQRPVDRAISEIVQPSLLDWQMRSFSPFLSLL